ncbi:hypothetical protein HAX54_013457, partial [Datura stramonium]|nr:hypothetical protein [Datura stramonium]
WLQIIVQESTLHQQFTDCEPAPSCLLVNGIVVCPVYFFTLVSQQLVCGYHPAAPG